MSGVSVSAVCVCRGIWKVSLVFLAFMYLPSLQFLDSLTYIQEYPCGVGVSTVVGLVCVPTYLPTCLSTCSGCMLHMGPSYSLVKSCFVSKRRACMGDDDKLQVIMKLIKTGINLLNGNNG